MAKRLTPMQVIGRAQMSLNDEFERLTKMETGYSHYRERLLLLSIAKAITYYVAQYENENQKVRDAIIAQLDTDKKEWFKDHD